MKHIRFSHQQNALWRGGFFFGTLFMLFGTALLLNIVFGFAIPIVRILLAFTFCYLGLRILFSPFFFHTNPFFTRWNHSQWSHSQWRGLKLYSVRREITHINVTDETIQTENFKLCFSNKQGQLTVDLSSLTDNVLASSPNPLNVYCSTREGKTEFKLPKTTPVTIFSENKRSQTYLPDGSYTHDGSHIYTSSAGEKPLIVMYVTTRFGNTTFTR